MITEKEKLRQIISLGSELSAFKDLDLLLEKILTLARRFTNAESGSIYIREENLLKFSYTQNDLLQQKLPPGKKLIYSTFTIPINCSSISGAVACTGKTLNIPDVYRIPPNAGYAFDTGYDRLSGYRTRSMMTVPLTSSRKGVIGVLQLINARNASGRIVPFSKKNDLFIEHFANTAATALERAQLTRAVIMRASKMAELRDPKETGSHVNRVSSYAVELYEAWANRRNMPSEEIDKNKDSLRMGAILHDVGKVAISDTILKKPARLDPDEYEVMKSHTVLGARLFADQYSEFDEAASIIALNHHERWDGNGYPGHINPMTGNAIPGYEGPGGKARGKKGEEIPPFGRIVAVADVYDALCSRRAYKEPWDEGRVFEELRNEAGRQFDPEMVEVFLSIADVIRNISQRFPD